jgi:hypothetical protein
MGKLYILLAVTLLLSIAALHYKEVTTKLVDTEKALSEKVTELENGKKSREDARGVREEYLETIRSAKNENDRLRACIADGSCLPRVRIKTTCPQLPANGNTAGTETATAELGRDAQQNYIRLVEEIKQLNAMYDMCLATLYDWSSYSLKNTRLDSVVNF